MAANQIVESGTRQFIVVKIGAEQFGIDINYIDNIVRMQKITRIPKAQHYFKGVINLRGEVVPVMSIRLKMGLEDDEFTNVTRIIIVKIEPQEALGIIVDEVKEVVTLEQSEIERVVKDSREEKSSFINGIGKHNGELISLFDLNSIIVDNA